MSAPITASAHTHVGTAPPGYRNEWVTHTVHDHGFESLSVARNEYFPSPAFMLLGNEWGLWMYPGGHATAVDGMVTLGLWNKSNKAIEIDFGFSVSDGNGKQVVYERSSTPEHFARLSYRGFYNIASRSDLMSSLVNKALVIDIHMKLATPTKSVPPPFIPENPSACKIIQGLFLDEKSSDIIFEVGGDDQGKNSARKVAKTTPLLFPAHRLIVENCSSIFADLCESHNDSATTPIQINDVKPNIFRLLLSYIYGVKVSEDNMVLQARDVIDAADKYGVVNLKLEAEASLVEGTTFTIENVMELLLYADSKNLALLKEAAIGYMAENRDEVLEKLSFTDVPGALVRDLWATARGEVRNNGTNVHVDNQYNALRISELRKRAHEKGLNVDGSREMLIAALKTVQDHESEVDSEVALDGSDESDEEPQEE
jgi:hypothetical protein